MTKDKVIAALPKLTKGDLKEVGQVVAHLLAKGDENVEAELWWDAITEALGTQQQFVTVRRTKVGKAMIANALRAEAFLEQLQPTKLRLARIVIRRFLADLMVADLRKRRLTPTPLMVIINLIRLPEVLDAAFPGYRAAGLTSLMFRNLGHDKETKLDA